MLKKPRVFISHSWADKGKAEKIYRGLRDFAEVWMDYRQLRPGDSIQNAIDDTLKNIDVVLLLWSSEAAESEGVQAEIETSQHLGLRIIPCFIEYDAHGNATPPLTGDLAGVLGQDFRHFGTALARITTLLMELQNGETGVFEHDPRKRLLQELDGLLEYMAHYLKTRGGDAPRTDWVERICEVFEEFVAQGGDANTLAPLLRAAEMMVHNDPEALSILVNRLQPLIQGHAAAASIADEMPQPKKKKNKKKKAKPQHRPEALAQLIEQHAPPGMAQVWSQAIDVYVQSAPPILNAMHLYSVGVGSQAGCEVVSFLNTYLNNGEDLIPDHMGRFGLLDDAWLINNTAYRLIESGVLPSNVVMADWSTIIQADQLARAFIPAHVLQTLEQYLMQVLSMIQYEVGSYTPTFGNMSGSKSTQERWDDVFRDSIDNIGSF